MFLEFPCKTEHDRCSINR